MDDDPFPPEDSNAIAELAAWARIALNCGQQTSCLDQSHDERRLATKGWHD